MSEIELLMIDTATQTVENESVLITAPLQTEQTVVEVEQPITREISFDQDEKVTKENITVEPAKKAVTRLPKEASLINILMRRIAATPDWAKPVAQKKIDTSATLDAYLQREAIREEIRERTVFSRTVRTEVERVRFFEDTPEGTERKFGCVAGGSVLLSMLTLVLVCLL